MNKDDKKEQTIVFSKIDPEKVKDVAEDNKDIDLERTQEITSLSGNVSGEDLKTEKTKKVKAPKKERKSKKSKQNTKEKNKVKKKSRDQHPATLTDIGEARKKEKTRRRVKRIIAILIVLIIGLGIYLTRLIWIPKLEGILDKPHDTIVNDGATETGNFPISLNDSSSNIMSRLDNNILITDDSKIYFYDINGKIRNTLKHNFATPMVKTSSKRVLVYDNGGSDFKVYNRSGEVYSNNVGSQIIYAEIADNGNVAVITQTEKYVACLTVYDSNGSEIYRWSCGQRIMNINFTSGGAGCYVSAFSSEDGQIYSQIYHVEFDKTEDLMVSDKIDSLIIDSYVNNNGKIWAVGDEGFYTLNSEGKIVASYEYQSDLVSYDMNSKCAAVVVEGLSHESYETVIFNSDSENFEPAVIDSDSGNAKKVVCDQNKIFVLNSTSVDAYDRKGNLLATAKISSEYSDFLYYNEALYVMSHREINKILFKT